MNTDFYKLINRFTNAILAIIFSVAILIIFIFISQFSINEQKKKEDNLSLIMDYIDANYSNISKIKENIYWNTTFQNDLISYERLATDEYLTDALKRGQHPMYLRNSLKTYMDQQNRDQLIDNTILSLHNQLFISVNQVNTELTLYFSDHLDFLNEDFPKNQLGIFSSPKHLAEQIQSGVYLFSISDGLSDFKLSEKEIPNTIPSETISYRKFKIKIYQQNLLTMEKLLTFIFLFILALLSILFMIKQISKRYFNNYLLQYDDILQSLEKSNYSENIQIDLSTKTGDLKEISEKINLYYDENERFIETQKENERLKLKAQFSSLQNQITPHFLFNNLEFIRMKAFLAGQEEISENIFALSQLYRNNTYQPDVISIQEELENINYSLQLYKYRYENFDFQIDNQILDLDLPKLSLQPFSENYIKHGFSSIQETNFLNIVGREFSDHYSISFNDNGKGISQEALEELQDKILEPFNADKHIGIHNSFTRLNIHFNQQVDISINSIENQSFSISLIIQKEDH